MFCFASEPKIFGMPWLSTLLFFNIRDLSLVSSCRMPNSILEPAMLGVYDNMLGSWMLYESCPNRLLQPSSIEVVKHQWV